MDSTKRYKRLLERYMNGDLDRRAFFTLLGAAGVAAGIVGGPFRFITRDALAAVTELRFDGWGGVVSEAVSKYGIQPFTAATGIKVAEGTFGGTDEFFAKVKASKPGEYNIFHSSGVFDYSRWVNAGFGTVINEDNVPNLKLVMESLMTPFRKITPEGLSAAPYDYGTTGLAWHRKHVTDDYAHEMGAKMLVDPQWKGKMGSYSDWREQIWFAALGSGQHPNDVKDMDAVWDHMREHRKLVLKYWSSGAELMSLFAEEEMYVSTAWSGRIARLRQEGHDIGFFNPPNGYGWMEAMFVIKGSPMAECEQLLNFLLEPEAAIAVAIGQNYPPSLDPMKVAMPEAVQNIPTYDPTGKLAALTFADPDYWNGHEGDWAKKANRVMKGF